ncbi:MAG: DUF3368 domain-containing protein [Bacteroidota bacterium]
MIVISDTSPITNLIKIGRLGLLRKIYPKIYIPKAVYDELLSWDYDGFEPSEIDAKWVEVCTVKDEVLLAQLKLELDPGEAEAIALAKEIRADFLLIDERKGWKIAKDQGINAIGLIGVLLKAKKMSLITEVMPLVDDLRMKAGFWLSEDFYLWIRQAVKE